MSDEELANQIEVLAAKLNNDPEMMEEFKRNLDTINMIALSSMTLIYNTNLLAIILGGIAMGYALGYVNAQGKDLDMSIWGDAFSD